MDLLANLAKMYYEKYLPSVVSRLKNPQKFWQALSREAQQAIEEIEDALVQKITASDFATKATQARMARSMAEELVLREMMPDPSALSDPASLALPPATDPSPPRPEVDEDPQIAAALSNFTTARDHLLELMQQKQDRQSSPNSIAPASMPSPTAKVSASVPAGQRI